jgi:hypothetical protein
LNIAWDRLQKDQRIRARKAFAAKILRFHDSLPVRPKMPALSIAPPTPPTLPNLLENGLVPCRFRCAGGVGGIAAGSPISHWLGTCKSTSSEVSPLQRYPGIVPGKILKMTKDTSSFPAQATTSPLTPRHLGSVILPGHEIPVRQRTEARLNESRSRGAFLFLKTRALISLGYHSGINEARARK